MTRLTLRARLTLLYTAVFFAAGLMMLIVNYAVVARSLEAGLPDFVAAVDATGSATGSATPSRSRPKKGRSGSPAA